MSSKATNLEMQNTIRKIATNFKQKTIISGDFNSHHTFWGDEKTDKWGKIIMEEIETSNMIIMRNDKATNIPSDVNKRGTAIDLTIVSQDIYMNIEKVITEYHIGLSQHKMIQIIINKETKIQGKIILKTTKILEQIANLNCDKGQSIKQISNKIGKIVKKNRYKLKHKPKSWWNRETRKAWIEKKQGKRSIQQRENIK